MRRGLATGREAATHPAGLVRLCEDYYDWCLRLARSWEEAGLGRQRRPFLELFEGGASEALQAHERNVFVQRHLSVLRHLKRLPGQPRVLDCACGTGYQSLLFGLAGAKVCAVEVYDKSVDVARRLSEALAAECGPLPVEIVHRDLFAFLTEQQGELAGFFDLIWVCEAISHIHPLEEFLPLVRAFLAPGGWLVVCESNTMNPLVRRKIDQEREASYRKRQVSAADFREGDYWLFPATYRDPVTGRQVQQTNERMLTPRRLRSMLTASGYRQFQVHYRTFIPPQLSVLLGQRLVRPLEALLCGLPLVRGLGIRYIGFAR